MDPQNTQAVKTHSRLNEWQACISLETSSEIQTSSKKAKDSSIQDSSKDRSFTSLASIKTPEISFDVFPLSRFLSAQRSDIIATLSTNAVVADPRLTREEKYEEGNTRLLTPTTRSPSLENDRSQNQVLSDLNTLHSHGSLPQGSQHAQGTNTAELSSARSEKQANNDISIENGNSPNQIKGDTDGPSTRVMIDPLADPNSVVRSPDTRSRIGFSTHPGLQNSALPNDQGKQQQQSSSPGSNVDEKLASALLVASRSFLVVKPDPTTSATVMRSDFFLQTNSDPLRSAYSTALNKVPESRSDYFILPPASTAVNSTSLTASSNTHEVPASAIIKASKETLDITAGPLPPSSVLGSNHYAVLANASTLSNTLRKPPDSIKSVFGNQTAPAFGSSNPSIAGGRVRASSSIPKGPRENTTVLPYKSGDERNVAFGLVMLFVCSGSVSLLFSI